MSKFSKLAKKSYMKSSDLKYPILITKNHEDFESLAFDLIKYLDEIQAIKDKRKTLAYIEIKFLAKIASRTDMLDVNYLYGKPYKEIYNSLDIDTYYANNIKLSCKSKSWLRGDPKKGIKYRVGDNLTNIHKLLLVDANECNLVISLKRKI